MERKGMGPRAAGRGGLGICLLGLVGLTGCFEPMRNSDSALTSHTVARAASASMTPRKPRPAPPAADSSLAAATPAPDSSPSPPAQPVKTDQNLASSTPVDPAVTQASAQEPADTEKPGPGDAPARLTPRPGIQEPASLPEAVSSPSPPAGRTREGADESHFAQDQAPPRRRSFVDLTAAPCFARAPDYSWIQGQIEYSRLSGGWRVRYASVDEVDEYGGCVTLIDDGHLGALKDGDYVRVQGHLSGSSDRTGSHTYRVESVTPVRNRNSVN